MKNGTIMIQDDFTDFGDEVVLVVDSKGRYLYASEACLRTLGVHASELIGQQISEAVPGILGARNRSNLLKAASGAALRDVIESAGGAFFEVDYKPVRVDGNTGYVVIRATRLADS